MLTIIGSIITVIGSIVVAVISNNKKEERKLAVQEKLSKALKSDESTKLEVAELFRIATGIRMKHSDIVEIVEDENSIWLVHLLNTNPGYVKYENGKLHYTEAFSKSWIRKGIYFFEKISVVSFTTMYFLSALGLIFSPNIEGKTVAGILLFVSAFLLIEALRNKRNSEKAKELIVFDLPETDSNKSK